MQQRHLLKLLRKRDRKAIEYLYDESYRTIERYALKVLGHPNDVPDFFQDAVIILLDKLDTNTLNYEKSVIAYFIGIARILILRKRTNNAKTMLTELVNLKLSDKDDLEQALQNKAQYDLFYKHFSTLDEPSKTILQLFFDGTPMKLIQEHMGYSSIAYTKKRKYLSQKKLIDRIKADPIYQELRFGT